ncbi:hypothetical protein KRX51_05745 [Corynebacterium sp. TAE3-ERU12]|uniref:hypothetical protein n=1 Tax=Corynebacterium sp. TAE3-ERU12 TaxID=2849491 RepID=UPI001C46E5EC|nr:hypothetical protein [Corynebacterium sp. TAE3-ERU12]MBV7295421.1 hypothetical protein [Corynebacterium sp. TAE3-ERU12]
MNESKFGVIGQKLRSLLSHALKGGGQNEPILREPTWARYIASVHPNVLNFIIVVLSCFAGAQISNGRIWIVALIFILIAICFGLNMLSERRDRDVEEERSEIQEEAVRSIIFALTDTTQAISHALHTNKKVERDTEIAAARRAILASVRERIGPPEGVRANLFEVSNTSPVELSASKYGHDGRLNHHSKRIFTVNDRTLRVAIENNQGRYIKDTSELEETSEKALDYDCFAVMPVSTGDELFGLLTVDSKNAGDIDEFHGTALLNQFASLLSLTYVGKNAENDAVPIGPLGADAGQHAADDRDGGIGVPASNMGQDQLETSERLEGSADDEW